MIYIYDFTHFRASKRCAVAVLDVASHVEVEVRSVEAAHEDERVAQVEPLDDLVPHGARGGGREGQHRG